MLYQSLFVLVALFLSAVTASVNIPLQSCSSGSDIVTINSATANVWPPVKGEEFTVDLSATVAQAINGGTYELKVAFDSIPLLDKTGPLTDLNITFPIKAGPITLSKSVQFPNIPISGSIDITIQAKDSNGNEIVCEKISLNLSTPKKQVEVTDVQIPYTSCAGTSDLATLSEVTANAWPPVKGSDLIITVHGTLSKAVNNGTYEIKASFDGIPILDQKGALSALTTLPLAAGAFSVSKTQNLPSIIPSGKIDITITATSDDGTEILCIKVEVNLSEPRPVATKVTDVQIPYTSCAGTSDLATLSEVTANAWPPVKGSDLIITVHGTLSKAVNNGTYEIKASFDGIPILDQKGALSALTTLPLAAGAFSVSKTQNLPSIIPSGKIDITITAADDDGTEILCIKVEVNLAEPLPIAVKVTDTPVPYSSCGSSSDIATLTSVTANQWPPQKNSDLSITANGNLNKDVNNGTYEIKAKFDGIQILKKHGELSDLVTLPLSAGPISIVKSVHLPKSIPSGKIEIEVTASSDDGSQILCFKVSVHMKAPAPIVPYRIAVKNHYPIIVSPFKVYSNVAVPFKSCGTSSDLFPITAVSATSWPPVSGSTIEMTSVFDAKSVINGGTYHYKAEYLGIVVQDKTDTLAAAGYQLPINPGSYTITQSVNAPSGLPPGHITTTTSATDENGKALFCFVIEFDV